METLITQSEPSIPELLFGGGTPRKAAMTALVVGTVLTGINHGDGILAGDYPPVVKIILTYCVPYCVTSWGLRLASLHSTETIRPKWFYMRRFDDECRAVL
ncbi:nitrate/nitrite transporter NrtS [Sulfitobacter sediminilitoris]